MADPAPSGSSATRTEVVERTPFSEWLLIHPEQSARMRQSTRCRQIVKVDGIQERLYRIRVQVTINDGRWRAGVPIFGHPAPEMITDSPAVLNRIKRLESEAQLLLSRNPYARHPRRPPLR